MGTGVVEVLTLQINLRAAQVFCHLFGVVQAGGAARILVQQFGQFAVELGVVFIVVIGGFQFDNGIHQRFGDVLPAVDAKTSVGVRHGVASFLTAATKAAIFSASLRPFSSMPELTSTA